MLHGLKTAMFVNEIEIDMFKDRRKKAERDFNFYDEKVEEYEAIYQKRVESDQKVTPKMIQMMKDRRDEAKNRIAMADGELDRIYSITHGNRRKYDFIKNYEVKKNYGDKGYLEQFAEKPATTETPSS